jgi:acetyl-CoA carboxylase biotin carboxyl carrier protein
LAEQDTTADDIKRLVALVVAKGLSELTIEEDGLFIQIKGAQGTVAAAPAQHIAPAPAAATGLDAIVEVEETPSGTRIALESPMVGVFYRSQSPEDPPFASVGDTIKVGQAIGLIEAMKVYSEVLAETAGRIVEIPVKDGALVQQGDPLLFLEPL